MPELADGQSQARFLRRLEQQQQQQPLTDLARKQEDFQAVLVQRQPASEHQTRTSIQAVQHEVQLMKGRITESQQDVCEEVLDGRVQQLDQHSCASNIMVFGLAEGPIKVTSRRATAVGQRLHDTTPVFSQTAVIHAQRLGKPRASKPRPVRVMLTLPTAKHRTFKAEGPLQQQRIRLYEDLTRASNADVVWPAVDLIRSIWPESSPHDGSFPGREETLKKQKIMQ